MAMICPRCSELFPDDAGFCPHDGAVLTKSTDRFLGKTLAARYHLTKKLGSGGMSLVYLARHELIARLSAIKILRPELSRIPEHRERFLREARAVNRINHENIVEISDVGESDGVAYLVMEYVEGESLLAEIQKGPMPWDRASRIAVQVASALARTHQTGIIHRDLKPENILLVPHQSAPLEVTAAVEHVKLTDFGIAKMMGEPTLTLNEQLFGTPGYIAPEYVEGQAIDGRADLYSLTVVLYEMVTGVLPFEGRGQSDLLLKPLTSAPIPPSRRVQGLPPDFEALLLRGLAREPVERPRDAFQFQDQLLDILRRYGSSVSQILLAEAPVEPRAPIETLVDQPAAAGTATANVGKLATKEMSSRGSTALAELETEIARARRAGGASAVVAGRAAEMALVASEMIPRIERASKFVGSLQAKVDRLEAIGREFRTNLGHAIDVLAHDRSREGAHLDALRSRRKELDGRAAAGGASGKDSGAAAESEPQPWEIAALAEEEARAEGVVADLQFQVDVLQKQLDLKNEEHEAALTEASGSLEGALSALRRLTNEIARTIDDGIAMLQESRR
jgi:serine/threonine-protein kinase